MIVLLTPQDIRQLYANDFDRTPVRRALFKPTPKIFGVSYMKCSLVLREHSDFFFSDYACATYSIIHHSHLFSRLKNIPSHLFHCTYATHDIPILAVCRMFVPWRNRFIFFRLFLCHLLSNTSFSKVIFAPYGKLFRVTQQELWKVAALE